MYDAVRHNRQLLPELPGTCHLLHGATVYPRIYRLGLALHQLTSTVDVKTQRLKTAESAGQVFGHLYLRCVLSFRRNMQGSRSSAHDQQVNALLAATAMPPEIDAQQNAVAAGKKREGKQPICRFFNSQSGISSSYYTF